jgi:hypothetical protein
MLREGEDADPLPDHLAVQGQGLRQAAGLLAEPFVEELG